MRRALILAALAVIALSGCRSEDVSFVASVALPPVTTTTPPPPLGPTIFTLSPWQVRSRGGENVTITGLNFYAPVRVLIDAGAAAPIEASVIRATPNEIVFLTPAVDLRGAQSLQATLWVLAEAGHVNERRGSIPLLIVSDRPTPEIFTISPSSGSITGGTRITIFGSGFEAPFTASFERGGRQADLTLIHVSFQMVVAIVPPFDEGFVDLRLRNIGAGTESVTANAFRYNAPIAITKIVPFAGPSAGGTNVVIDGIGFRAPASVIVAGLPALVLRLSGTSILVRTQPGRCGQSGPVIVTMIDDGETVASARQFVYTCRRRST